MASRRPSIEWEKKQGYPELHVAGVDEVGRGCLAGPVVAAALVLPADICKRRDPWLKEIRDSKLIDEEDRERLAPLILGWALDCAVGMAEVAEIDQINIYHASHLAMKRAIASLARAPQRLIVDGNVVPKGLPCGCVAIVKGDLKCLSVAAASIVAKVHRDRLMREYDTRFPGYGFSSHKGYSTPVHQKALQDLGACEIHRRSFAPVAERLGLRPKEPSPELQERFVFDLLT